MIMMCLILMTEITFPEQPDIRLEITGDQAHQVYFFAPHENEHVVNAYLKEKIRSTGKGRFLILRQNGERHTKLKVDGHIIELDPNRMFTSLGVRSSLLILNKNLKEDSPIYTKAHKLSLDLGKFVLKTMGPISKDVYMIAIHNNTDGYDNDGKGGVGTISIVRYQDRKSKGAKYIKDLFAGEGDEDDLFFITEDSDFKNMSAAGWNVLLQHPQVAWLDDEDDGSLSVYAEKIGASYINVEAQRKHDDGSGKDHLKEQSQMVDLVFELVFPKK